MPYIGTKVRNHDEMVTVKVFGNHHLFQVNPTKFQEIVSSAINSGPFDDEPVVGISKVVAKALDENVNAFWVECEILNAEGHLFGNTHMLPFASEV